MASARLRRLNPTQSPTLPPNWAKNIFSFFIQSSKRLFYQQDQPIHKGVLLNTLLLRGSWRRCEPKRNEIIYSPLCCIIRKMKCTNVYIFRYLKFYLCTQEEYSPHFPAISRYSLFTSLLDIGQAPALHWPVTAFCRK